MKKMYILQCCKTYRELNMTILGYIHTAFLPWYEWQQQVSHNSHFCLIGERLAVAVYTLTGYRQPQLCVAVLRVSDAHKVCPAAITAGKSLAAQRAVNRSKTAAGSRILLPPFASQQNQNIHHLC